MTEHSQTMQGWENCPKCGYYVPQDGSHDCGGQKSYAAIPINFQCLPDSVAVLIRIADALEGIKEALCRKKI